MGLVGAIGGALLGVAMQRIFPGILKSFLPLTISTAIFWGPIIRGLLIGLAICILFALPALLRFRRLSPLGVFRAEIEQQASRRDPLLWLVYALIGAGITAFSISQAETLTRGLIFAAGLGVAGGIFAWCGQVVDCRCSQILSERLELCLAAGVGEPLSPEQSNASADVVVRIWGPFCCSISI